MSSCTCDENEHGTLTSKCSLFDGLRTLLHYLWGNERIQIGQRTFRLERVLREGGFGCIYMASEERDEFHTQYAVKKMLLQSEEQEEKARQETGIMESLRHPALLQLICHDYQFVHRPGREPVKACFLVTPAFPEGNLLDAWADVPPGKLRFSPAEVVHIMLQITEGMGALHSRGLCHRDVTPGNVLLDTSGSEPRAVLCDFGSCRTARVEINSRKDAVAAQEEAQQNTTAAYRPPELWDCPTSGVVRTRLIWSALVLAGTVQMSVGILHAQLDERVDVWSLGATMFYAMYGVAAFEAGSVYLAALSKRLNWQGAPSVRHPEELHNLMDSCLFVQHTERPYAHTVAERLRGLKQSFPLEDPNSRPHRAQANQSS